MRWPVKPKSIAQLKAMSTPGAAVGGQSEAVPWVWFDTLTYVDNVTTELIFLSTTNADKTLNNMQGPGSIPDPQYFEVYYAGLDVLEPVSVLADAAVAAAWDDVQQLILTGRPTWTFELANKNLGPFPASFLHSSGGLEGFAAAGTGNAIDVTSAYGRNGPVDGGFCFDGSIIIPPTQNFQVTMRWPAAVNIAADRLLRFWLAGTLHRRVV